MKFFQNQMKVKIKKMNKNEKGVKKERKKVGKVNMAKILKIPMKKKMILLKCHLWPMQDLKVLIIIKKIKIKKIVRTNK